MLILKYLALCCSHLTIREIKYCNVYKGYYYLLILICFKILIDFKFNTQNIYHQLKNINIIYLNCITCTYQIKSCNALFIFNLTKLI